MVYTPVEELPEPRRHEVPAQPPRLRYTNPHGYTDPHDAALPVTPQLTATARDQIAIARAALTVTDPDPVRAAAIARARAERTRRAS